MMNFDTYKLIRQLLPTFSRKPLRLAWLDTMLSPHANAWNEYIDWRLDKYYESNVTCQVISIEAYLNRLFDSEQKRIQVIDAYFNEIVYIALREENYDNLYIDGDEGKIIYLESEQTGNGFIVNIDEALADYAAQIAGIVEKIRALGVGCTVMVGDMPYITLSATSIWLPSQAGDGAITDIHSNTDWMII
jgi:hypothetical protein